MPRQINKLSARTVASLTKPGRHSDGGGLYLSISKDGSSVRRRWVFLYRWRGRLTELGLGGFHSVSLAKARELATAYRTDLTTGVNPKEKRDRHRDGARGVPTFGECAETCIATKGSGWRNAKHRQQWQNTLRVYAAPLRPKPVDTITTADVLALLKPIWKAKPETASRLRGRIESILDAARVNGYIAEGSANPARWRGHLDKLLPQRERLTRGHHAAMAYVDVPSFVAHLRARVATAALALEFIILTAARSGEALGAQWSEIDLKNKIWEIPSTRMKGGRPHRVPLSARAVEIIKVLVEVKCSDFIFPGNKPNRPLSNMATDMLLRRMGAGEVTTHGFRSSFRDWAGDCTSFPKEVAEAALAHAVGDETERAYRRGDALEKRRKLMDDWAAYLEPNEGNLEELTRTRRASDPAPRH
jgi:integrase